MISRFTLVQVKAASSDKPSVEPWAPNSYEEPGLETAHKLLGVTMTDSEPDEPVACMKRGYMRGVPGESWSVGDILWADSNGVPINSRPSAPLPLVVIGTVFQDEGAGLFTVVVDVRVLPSLGELSGVSVETPEDCDVFIFNAGGSYWEPRRLIHTTDLTPDSLLTPDHPSYHVKHGFERDSAGDALLSISYDKSTKKVTLTPTGDDFTFYIDGVQWVKVGAQVAGTVHGTTTGKYYFYYDSSGILQTSAVNTPWSIIDRTVIPVAIVYWNNTLADGICFFEAHGADRNLWWHYLHHQTEGTELITGGALAGWLPATETDAAVTFSIATATIADEDIICVLTGIADGGPYHVTSRSGATGEWTWDDTPIFPWISGTTYPKWNNVDAGGSGIWGLTELVGTDGGEWMNVYILATPAVTAIQQFYLVPGQAKHTTLASAQAEQIESLAWGTLPFEECAPLWKVTLHARSTYGGTHKTVIVSVTAIASKGLSITLGIPQAIAALDDIGDVTAPSPNDGDVLTWDATLGRWIAAAPSGAPAGSASASISPSGSASPSASASATGSASASESPSSSASASHSPSGSASASESPSASTSATASASESRSTSASQSPSGSESPSASASATASASVSPSASPSGTGGGTAHLHGRFAMFSPPAGVSFYPLMVASSIVTVGTVRVIHTGSGTASVNVKKNHRAANTDILDSDLASAATWQDAAATGGGVSLVSGDELDVELASVAGYVEHIIVQVDYTEML